MARFKIFDPETASLEDIQKKLRSTKDLVAQCELAIILKEYPKLERSFTVLSYCIAECLATLDIIEIEKASFVNDQIDVHKEKLKEIKEKLSILLATPKKTKTYLAVVESLTKRREEYTRLVENADIPPKCQKHIATLEVLLSRLEEVLEELGNYGISYNHLLITFPRLKKLIEYEIDDHGA